MYSIPVLDMPSKIQANLKAHTVTHSREGHSRDTAETHPPAPQGRVHAKF